LNRGRLRLMTSSAFYVLTSEASGVEGAEYAMTRLNRFLIFLVVAVWGANICNVLADRFGPSINIPLVVFGALLAGVGLVISKG